MSSAIRNQETTLSWEALPDVRGHSVGILNTTGVLLYVCMTADTADASKYLVLADGQSVGLNVAENANEVSVRADTATEGVNIVVQTY